MVPLLSHFLTRVLENITHQAARAIIACHVGIDVRTVGNRHVSSFIYIAHEASCSKTALGRADGAVFDIALGQGHFCAIVAYSYGATQQGTHSYAALDIGLFDDHILKHCAFGKSEESQTKARVRRGSVYI